MVGFQLKLKMPIALLPGPTSWGLRHARLLGALLHGSGSIDDLQVRDAPEGHQCRPRSIAIVVPDLEQGNVVIDLGILEQSIAGCETAALLKNL